MNYNHVVNASNDLLEEQVNLIFEKLVVIIEAMDIVGCHRLEETGKVIAKLLNRKDAQNILEEKHELRSIIVMVITPIPTIKGKSSLAKAFAHTIGNFMV